MEYIIIGWVICGVFSAWVLRRQYNWQVKCGHITDDDMGRWFLNIQCIFAVLTGFAAVLPTIYYYWKRK